jgi:hypothetical protein
MMYPYRHIKTQTEGSIPTQTNPSEMSGDSHDYAVLENSAIRSKNLQSPRFAESLMQQIQTLSNISTVKPT